MSTCGYCSIDFSMKGMPLDSSASVAPTVTCQYPGGTVARPSVTVERSLGFVTNASWSYDIGDQKCAYTLVALPYLDGYKENDYSLYNHYDASTTTALFPTHNLIRYGRVGVNISCTGGDNPTGVCLTQSQNIDPSLYSRTTSTGDSWNLSLAAKTVCTSTPACAKGTYDTVNGYVARCGYCEVRDPKPMTSDISSITASCVDPITGQTSSFVVGTELGKHIIQRRILSTVDNEEVMWLFTPVHSPASAYVYTRDVASPPTGTASKQQLTVYYYLHKLALKHDGKSAALCETPAGY